MNKIIRFSHVLALSLFLSLLASAGLLPLSIQAAPPTPGSLDTTFGIGGKVTTTIGSGFDYGQAVAVQDDGRIVVAGYSSNGSDNDFALARYNTDGNLDTTFGSGGIVTTDFGGGFDQGKAVVMQEDGRIVVAGYSSNGSDNDFALARYNTNGSLDTTFGSDGKVTTDFSGYYDYGYAVAVQVDGRIVVAGYSMKGGNNDFALARYNTDGNLDTTFGSGGIMTTDFGGGPDSGHAVAIQEDGRIVVAGSSFNGSDDDFALVRYTDIITSPLDTTFGSGGKVTTDFGGGYDSGYAVAMQNDGRIVVAGYSSSDGNYDFALARYNTDGNLDTTFGSGGVVTTPIGSNDDYGWAVAVQDGGRIVVAGHSLKGGHNDFALARYSTDGTLDTAFGSGGKVTTDFGGGYDSGQSVAVQDDGQIVVAGYSSSDGNIDFALARYIGANAINVYLPVIIK